MVGLVTAWRLAGMPTSFSPLSVKATMEGVVRAPSAFSITFAPLPSITATQLLVVPRSIPITSPPPALAARPRRPVAPSTGCRWIRKKKGSERVCQREGA